MNLSKIKLRVRQGKLSPLEALDHLNRARLKGRPADPKLERWVNRRIEQARKKYGTHGHLFRGR